jgi:hypothetical protein
MKDSTLSKAAAELGRRGGLATTKAKVKASRSNGKLGGRPAKYPKCPKYSAHRFRNDLCPCGFRR